MGRVVRIERGKWGKNFFHRIRPESIRLFVEDRTAMAGTVTKGRYRNPESREASKERVRLLDRSH